METTIRSELLLGKESTTKLNNAHVAIFGLGGVGGYVLEVLARANVGTLDLFDGDAFAPSNCNRQILATKETIGKRKVEVAKERVLSINPNCHVNIYDMFYSEENADTVPFSSYDYIVDAIDNMKAKVSLIVEAKKANVRIISSMGTGNRLDPTKFVVTDVFKTEGDPVARIMRSSLRKEGIDACKVVWSKETPISIDKGDEKGKVIGSVPFVPSVAGIILASEVIKDILS